MITLLSLKYCATTCTISTRFSGRIQEFNYIPFSVRYFPCTIAFLLLLVKGYICVLKHIFKCDTVQVLYWTMHLYVNLSLLIFSCQCDDDEQPYYLETRTQGPGDSYAIFFKKKNIYTRVFPAILVNNHHVIFFFFCYLC